MTQRERIHQMLRSAGPRGVRSDDFFAAHMPRAAARIQELRDSGVEISSEREGKFCRYYLVKGGDAREAGNRPCVAAGRQDGKDLGASVRAGASVASESSAPEGQLFQLPSRSAFTDSEWAA